VDRGREGRGRTAVFGMGAGEVGAGTGY